MPARRGSRSLPLPRRWLPAVLLALAPATDAAARVRWSTPGSYRLRVHQLTDVPLDEQGTTTGQHIWGTHRLRIDPTIEAGPTRVHIQLDVLTGQIFGETNAIGSDFVERRYGNPERSTAGWTTVEPRMLWIDWEWDWGYLHAGQLGADFGLGLVDHDGLEPDADEARYVERFGDVIAGDLVDRLMIAVRPLAPVSLREARELVLAAGTDYVWQDDEARLLDDDSAWRVFGMLLYPGEEVDAGVMAVHRRQTDANEDRLVTTTFDAYSRWLLPLYRLGADLRVQGELALVTGHTNRQRTAGSGDESTLLQLGWTLDAQIAWRCPRLATGIEAAYASGDADPADSQLRAFTFDPGRHVGLVLFPDVLRLVTLRAAERLADPTRVGRPPGGADQLPTDGAVRNALYFMPGVTWRPGAWRLSTSALVAWAAEPFLDPYRTLESGGPGRSHRDVPAARFYGTEVMAGVHYTVAQAAFLEAMEIGTQAGVLFPGGALEGEMGDDPIVKIMGRLDLRWQ